MKPQRRKTSLSPDEIRLLLDYEKQSSMPGRLLDSELGRVAELYRFVEFGRLSSGIFHDLLNPLTTISLSVQDLKNSQGVYSHELVERALRASKQIESFIQIARKQLLPGGAREHFSPEKEVREAMELLMHKSLVMGVKLEIASACKAKAYGNPIRFFRIMVNLISNAIDSYSDFKNDNTEKIVRVAIFSDDNNIKCEVKDFGCGIPLKFQKSIFNAFFTTKKDGKGMGLGLSTAKDEIEKEFKGTIALSSVKNKGSVFTVAIPAIKA